MGTIEWLAEPEPHDYTAAESYLSLLMEPGQAAATAGALRSAVPAHHAAKDILRAAGLGLLPESDAEVSRDLKKVRKGRRLAPVLLVRGRLGAGVALTVADGYHRVCAAYHLDEDCVVPVRITAAPRATAS